MLEQVQFTYTSIEKVFEKQTKTFDNQANVLKSFYNKMNKLKQVKDIFPNNQLINLIKDRLK